MSTTFLITTKSGMTRIFREDGTAAPVTALRVLPQEVARTKSVDKDGYTATVVRSGKKLKECKDAEVSVDITTLTPNQKVLIIGQCKGKGFAGTIKRHAFHRGPASHGSKNVRKPGSIGSGYPQHVLKGMKMAGHMGDHQVSTTAYIEAVSVKDQVIFVRGAIPGSRGTQVTVQTV